MLKVDDVYIHGIVIAWTSIGYVYPESLKLWSYSYLYIDNEEAGDFFF